MKLLSSCEKGGGGIVLFCFVFCSLVLYRTVTLFGETHSVQCDAFLYVSLSLSQAEISCENISTYNSTFCFDVSINLGEASRSPVPRSKLICFPVPQQCLIPFVYPSQSALSQGYPLPVLKDDVTELLGSMQAKLKEITDRSRGKVESIIDRSGPEVSTAADFRRAPTASISHPT